MPTLQSLLLELDGITADDYLAHARDPEPASLGAALLAIAVRARRDGEAVEAILNWRGDAPVPVRAAALAGLPVTADVRAVHELELAARPLAAAA